MKNEAYLYPYSTKEAQRREELSLWRESHRANIACKDAIEGAIRRDFNGMHLKPDCAKSVIEKYGFKRTNFVLANTLQQKDDDGRFSRDNKAWAAKTFIPPDPNHNNDFVVDSHPAVLDGFVNEYRRAYEALQLFGAEHCEPDSGKLDFEGKVLVLSPRILKEGYWRQEDQLWYAHDGFGCDPNAIGRSIRSTCLGDGEQTRWNRHDFIGVLKDEYLPEWATEKLEQLQPRQDAAPQLSL